MMQPANDDRRLLTEFAQRGRLATPTPSLASLEEVATAFAALPYENLSKIVRQHDQPVSQWLESPEEILRGHWESGTGGTCFSLTATLLQLVRTMGFEAQPILADRPYGADTHCALLVWIEDQPHLLDPGFLLVRPVPVGQPAETLLDTGVHTLSLRPQANGERLELFTREPNGWKNRLTFKLAPVDHGQFEQAWRGSFDWDMMRYPVLTRCNRQEQLYVRGLFEQRRGAAGIQRGQLQPSEYCEQIARMFGIAPEIVQRALRILEARGELANW